MAQKVTFDLTHPLVEAGLESPADEESVHDSFSQLIAEHDQGEEFPDAFELQLLDEEGPDNRVSWLRPEHKRQHENELEDDGLQTNSLIQDHWSSATLKILSSMPSRTVGRNRGAIISQYCNKTMRLRRRRQSRPTIRDFSRSARPSIRGFGVETVDSGDTERNNREDLLNNLQNLSVGERSRTLREMPLCLAEKSQLWQALHKQKQEHASSCKLHCCSHLKYLINIALRHIWYSWLSFLHSLDLWKVPLKTVSGRFGTGVLSYFLFIKTLLFFNIFLLIVMGAFLVLPQALYPPVLYKQRRPFSGLELLTGAGFFSDTLLYYGYYSNSNYTLQSSCMNSTLQDCKTKYSSYNMPLAYFFTIGIALFITCIILVYSMSKSFGRSFRIDKSCSILAMKTFCSWDFKVIKTDSVRLMSENIATQLKELLAEASHNHVTITLSEKVWKLMIHGLAWTVCIAGTTGCVIGIYYLSENMHSETQVRRDSNIIWDSSLEEASLLALPVVVSLINLLLPSLFNLIAWMEGYHSPSVRTYVALSRNLLLKVSVLGVLCYHWLGRVPKNAQVYVSDKCWESFVGQELYRFLIVDFIFALLDTLFRELLWRLFANKVLQKKRKPVFDIAKNVLDLIYGQTLAWLGVLFTPLLPAVQILKLLLLFYIKKSSVMLNCQAPRKPYRVSQMTTIFITLLCFPAFLGACVCVTYTMWSVEPSESCGPFRGLSTMFKAGKIWMKELEKQNPNLSVLSSAHTYLVENPLFLFVAAGIFLIVIYFHSQVVDGQRKIITLLQEQITYEGADKEYLISELQRVNEQKPTSVRTFIRQESAC